MTQPPPLEKRALSLLGPQRHRPIVQQALEDRLPVGGRVALISAGWEEREHEIDELVEHLGDKFPVVSLPLYARFEHWLTEDIVFRRRWQHYNDLRRAEQEVYQLRLTPTLGAARELLSRRGPDEVLAPARESALAAVRDLDAFHASRKNDLHDHFYADISEHSRLLEERHRTLETLRACDAVCIAGGHVSVLSDRLRAFAPLDQWTGTPSVLCAWSAGAMVMANNLVLFHDSPPQGAGDSEVDESGAGMLSGVLPLPHGRSRLRLDDTTRVRLFASRFAPDDCVTLEDGTWLEPTPAGARLRAGHSMRLHTDGRLTEVRS